MVQVKYVCGRDHKFCIETFFFLEYARDLCTISLTRGFDKVGADFYLDVFLYDP